MAVGSPERKAILKGLSKSASFTWPSVRREIERELKQHPAFIYVWERTKGYAWLAKLVGLPVVKQLSKIAYAILAFLLFYKYKIFSK